LPAKSVLTLIGDVEIYNPKYLIDGIIEESSLVGLIGPSGAGKTFVALDMALSMATGKDYHGLFAKKGLAILSAGEGHLGIPRSNVCHLLALAYIP
jgi:ABC-type transporter Mla maintaining outer membrane lipid asymmetry ATPase subunit MlaF